jgi:DNA-binding protein YbaB
MVIDVGRKVMMQVVQETEKGFEHKREAVTETEIGSVTGSGHVIKNDLQGKGTVTDVGIGVRNVTGGEIVRLYVTAT